MAGAHVCGLVAGYAADALLGDPHSWHPVAGFGRAAGALERVTYAPTRAAGARYAAIAVGGPVAAAIALHRATRQHPIARAAVVAVATWAAVGGTSLAREADAMADELDADDLEAARRRVPNLCGRDPSALDAGDIGRATVESVAENTSDATVAPLLWGGVAGLPGIVGYRAVNTLDAMVGHRSDRYRDFGTAAARLDDVANFVPSRVTALLTIPAAAIVADRAGPAGRCRRGPRSRAFATFATWLRDRNQHPSPNSGQCEAAMAGALGVRLGGRNVYHGRVDVRPTLGRGPLPGPCEIRRATRISRVVGAFALAAGVAAATGTAAGAAFLRNRRGS
ncbi:MAG TPA: cobalamin biosynthesis protein [Micromonosporaceae bacterium]